jgi:predicted transcriptional regulator YdeE
MKVKEIEKLMIAGISTVTNNKDEMDESTAKIAGLWNKYMDENIFGKTFNKSRKDYLYGVYSDYESDVDGNYKVTIGTDVTKPKNAIVIENQRYLVFTKKGEFPDVVTDTWAEIWEYFSNEDSQYKRSYKIDFEKYLSMDEIEIYISIL